MATHNHKVATKPQFETYQFGSSYDEMFADLDEARPAYRILYERIQELTPSDFARRQRAADLSFLNQGITFTVYNDNQGTERIFPYDLLPRIITGREWATIERGLIQRITALNLFLKDVYHDGHILKDKVIPRSLIYSCKHYRREMRGVHVPHDIYITVVGTDLVRLPDGQFAVLRR